MSDGQRPVLSVIVGNLNQDQTGDLDSGVQLRHEAGLTAGLIMPLGTGSFQFGPQHTASEGLGSGEPEATSFQLTVEGADRIFAARGDEPLAVEGTPVLDRVQVRPGEVLQLATDHFMVDSTASTKDTSPPTQLRVPPLPKVNDAGEQRWGLLLGLVAVIGLALVLALAGVGIVRLAIVVVLGLSIVAVARYLLSKRADEKRREQRAIVTESFTTDLRAARSAAARELRHAHPGPAGVSDLAAGRRSLVGAFDGQVSIASGDLGWQPRIDDGATAGWNHDAIVTQHDFLPAVPFTVDIDHDTIGIVGNRRSVLAVARHLLTATMVQADRSELRITISAADDRQADWAWLDGFCSAGRWTHEINVFDGVVPPRSGPGFVILAEADDELVVDCGTTLIVRDDGVAMAETQSGSATGLVPHGITETHAQSIVAALAEVTQKDAAIGDTPPVVVPPDDHAPIAPLTEMPADAPTIDLTPERRASAGVAQRLMVVGEPGEDVVSLVASAVLDHASEHPDRPMFVLDRGDRSLIRLAQLPSCHGYAAIDDVPAATEMMERLEEFVASGREIPALLVVSDLGRALEFYRRAGLADPLGRLESLLDQRSRLVCATASTRPGTEGLEQLVHRFPVFVFASADDQGAAEGLLVLDSSGEHRVHDFSVAGLDLTDKVARMTFASSNARRAS